MFSFLFFWCVCVFCCFVFLFFFFVLWKNSWLYMIPWEITADLKLNELAANEIQRLQKFYQVSRNVCRSTMAFNIRPVTGQVSVWCGVGPRSKEASCRPAKEGHEMARFSFGGLFCSFPRPISCWGWWAFFWLITIRSASDYYRILEVKYHKLPNRPGNFPILPVFFSCRWNSEMPVFTCQGDSMRTDRYLLGWYNLLRTLRVQYTEAAPCMSDWLGSGKLVHASFTNRSHLSPESNLSLPIDHWQPAWETQVNIQKTPGAGGHQKCTEPATFRQVTTNPGWVSELGGTLLEYEL